MQHRHMLTSLTLRTTWSQLRKLTGYSALPDEETPVHHLELPSHTGIAVIFKAY